MERHRTPRRRPEAPSAPTTLHEITRRYVATALALAKAMGLPWTEDFMRQHRESISCCFIEAGRAGVQLPPLTAPGDTPPPGDPPPVGHDVPTTVNGGTPEADGLGCTGGLSPEAPPPNGDTPPLTVVPTDAGLPCAGVAIADLKPAQLAMLVSKTARLVHDEGKAWVPLLGALQSERSQRLERGRKPSRPGSAEKG